MRVKYLWKHAVISTTKSNESFHPQAIRIMDLHHVTSHLFLQPDKFTLPSACPRPLIIWLTPIDYVNVYFFIYGKLFSPPTVLFATLDTYISESLWIILCKDFSSPESVDVCVGGVTPFMCSSNILFQAKWKRQVGSLQLCAITNIISGQENQTRLHF